MCILCEMNDGSHQHQQVRAMTRHILDQITPDQVSAKGAQVAAKNGLSIEPKPSNTLSKEMFMEGVAHSSGVFAPQFMLMATLITESHMALHAVERTASPEQAVAIKPALEMLRDYARAEVESILTRHVATAKGMGISGDITTGNTAISAIEPEQLMHIGNSLLGIARTKTDTDSFTKMLGDLVAGMSDERIMELGRAGAIKYATEYANIRIAGDAYIAGGDKRAFQHAAARGEINNG